MIPPPSLSPGRAAASPRVSSLRKPTMDDMRKSGAQQQQGGEEGVNKLKEDIRRVFGVSCGLSSGETRRAFLHMDRDRDGFISEADLKETLENFNISTGTREAGQLLEQVIINQLYWNPKS